MCISCEGFYMSLRCIPQNLQFWPRQFAALPNGVLPDPAGRDPLEYNPGFISVQSSHLRLNWACCAPDREAGYGELGVWGWGPCKKCAWPMHARSCPLHLPSACPSSWKPLSTISGSSKDQLSSGFSFVGDVTPGLWVVSGRPRFAGWGGLFMLCCRCLCGSWDISRWWHGAAGRAPASDMDGKRCCSQGKF